MPSTPKAKLDKKPTQPETQRRHRLGSVLAGIALIVGVLAVWAGSQESGERLSYQSAPVVATPFYAADPDTSTPDADLGPELPPLTISIPSLGINAPVTESGTDTEGALQLPTSDKATRYNGAAEIGARAGSTVIAGHVNFPDGSPGALAPLANVTKGSPIYITDAAGMRHIYTATTAETLVKTQLPGSLFTTTGQPQLVLITCGGPIENTGNGILGYTHNTVITATLATNSR